MIKSVERLCSSFLWNGVSNSALGAKIKWEDVCKPKTEGSLGLKDLNVWNMASIARQFSSSSVCQAHSG